jgi:hypothetical protein
MPAVADHPPSKRQGAHPDVPSKRPICSHSVASHPPSFRCSEVCIDGTFHASSYPITGAKKEATDDKSWSNQGEHISAESETDVVIPLGTCLANTSLPHQSRQFPLTAFPAHFEVLLPAQHFSDGRFNIDLFRIGGENPGVTNASSSKDWCGWHCES